MANKSVYPVLSMDFSVTDVERLEAQCLGELQASVKNVVARAQGSISSDTDEASCPDFTPDEFDVIAMLYNNLISKIQALRPIQVSFDQLTFHKTPFKPRDAPVCRRHTMQQMVEQFKGRFYPYFISAEPNEDKRGQLPDNWYKPSIQELRFIFTCFVRSYSYYSSIFVCEIKSLLSDKGIFECIHREFVNLSAYREFRGRVLDNIKWVFTKALHSVDCMECLPCFAYYALVPDGETQPPFDYEKVHKMTLKLPDNPPRCLHSEFAKTKDLLTMFKAYRWYFANVPSPRALFQEILRYYCQQQATPCPSRGFMFHQHEKCTACQMNWPGHEHEVLMAMEDIILKSYGKYETFFGTYAGTQHNQVAADKDQQAAVAMMRDQKRLLFVPTEMIVQKVELRSL